VSLINVDRLLGAKEARVARAAVLGARSFRAFHFSRQ